ncbi:YfcL family protein [Shewanella salipaludis]|uniref:YfcL family protein n=1 Tax=Shewanella salipaludis TaxID=2723052 RepID=A0A972JJF4_9GAMM|nr:YfcL family protein [Shewanella salipaludis]NMH66053.1 YfcL family protein [Shewanella salipaludis]
MLEKYESALEQWITSVVGEGDDDALFACGYLQGHVAVVLAQLETDGSSDLAALELKMIDCLELANRELNDADYGLVEQAWAQLRQRIAA